MEKSVFVLKVYNLTITNIDLQQTPVITKHCFQNIQRIFRKFLFQKYSKDIPVVLQGYENILRSQQVQKIALWVIL